MWPSAFLRRRSFIYKTQTHTQKVSSICDDDYRTTTQQPPSPPPPGLCFSFSQTAKFFPTNRVEFSFFFFFSVGTLVGCTLFGSRSIYHWVYISSPPLVFVGVHKELIIIFFSMDIPLGASPSNHHQSHQKLIDSYYRFLDQFTFFNQQSINQGSLITI